MMGQQSGKYYTDRLYLTVSVGTHNFDILQNLQHIVKHQNNTFFAVSPSSPAIM